MNINHIRLCYRFTYPDKPINFGIRINNTNVLHCHGVKHNVYVFDYKFTNQTQNKIELVVSGKTNSHTVLDNQGNILNTSQIEIQEFIINNVDILDLAYSNEHLMSYNYIDNNTEHSIAFDPILGFNGIVTYEF